MGSEKRPPVEDAETPKSTDETAGEQPAKPAREDARPPGSGTRPRHGGATKLGRKIKKYVN